MKDSMLLVVFFMIIVFAIGIMLGAELERRPEKGECCCSSGCVMDGNPPPPGEEKPNVTGAAPLSKHKECPSAQNKAKVSR